MALNHWKLGGQPTSYNPLPAGWGNNVPLKSRTDYVLTFKAKSPSNTKLWIYYVEGVTETKITLTDEFQEYTFNRPYSQNGNIIFYDLNSTGDIIIEDIKLVEKPLPKHTINGIDGFKSGKWSLHANATVVDDETLELNADSTSSQASYLDFIAESGKDHYWNVETENGSIQVLFKDKNGATLSTQITKSGTAKSPMGTASIRFVLFNGGQTGKFTFKRPMLNLGATPAPYEPKRGERMVEPVPVKNLFNKETITEDKYLGTSGTLFDSGANNNVSDFIDVDTNSNFTISGFSYDGATLNGNWFNSNKEYIGVFTVKNGTVKSPTNAEYTRVTVNDVDLDTFQLEQGTIATAYEPYAVQANKHARNLVPKLNLIPSFYDSRWNKHANLTVVGDYEAVLDATAGGQTSEIYIPVVGGMSYAFSGEITETDTSGRFYLAVYDANKNYLSIDATLTASGKLTIQTPTNARFIRVQTNSSVAGQFTFKNPQLVEGSTAQAFEPYEEVLPRAKTGLVMPGNAYVQLPSMTMDSIEIDCLIDSVQSNNYPVLADFRSGLSNGYLYADGTGGTTSIEVLSKKPIPKGEKTTISISIPTISDDVTLFVNYVQTAASFLKGTIYGVKCYLNGQVVAEYDFTNPNNIVGDKLIPNAKNLIPSFDSGEWSLHSNFKVFGPNVGRLDASGSTQISDSSLPVKSGGKYLFNIEGNGRFRIRKNDNSGIDVLWSVGSFTVPDDMHTAYIRLDSGLSGTFDFVKPSLYELTGKEAQLFGSPTLQLKTPKRILYAKR